MQKGIIVGVNTYKNINIFNSEMDELKELCKACEIEVVESVCQNLEEENIKTYLGKGKLEELKVAIRATDCDVCIFNDELSPSQISTLENILDILVFDRTYVILEIFKRRAKTREAILQVDIASLRYMLPRLSGLRSGFSRQRGAGGAAHGKGKGETQLEIDRRNIGDRISLLKGELKDLTKNRKLQRKQRKDNNEKTVCLVGYTNSGKSTTLNTILNYSKEVKKEVMEKDMLFATLETQTRKIRLDNNRKFLLTDTVGFVSKLPHDLIEAFKSTLEEIKEADLILHIVDASNSEFEEQIRVTNDVLNSLGVLNIPMIYCFNKIDKVDDYFYIPPKYENSIRISSKNDYNINNLIDMIISSLYSGEITTTFIVPYTKGEILNDLKTNALVLDVKYEDFIFIKAQVNEVLYKKYQKYEEKE